MPRSLILLSGLPALFAAFVVAAAEPIAPAETVDDLVARNIQAHGGLDALHAMNSLRLSGKLLVNDGQFELGFVQTVKRPAFVRNEATIQGLTQVQAWDGQAGWQINPFQGRKDPERMSADDTKSLAETAQDFDGPLVDWQAKGHTLSYLGREDIDGTLAYKLRLTRRNGDTEIVWLDPDYFLEIRLLSQRTERGVKVETETDLGDYEKVSGVYLPFAIDSSDKGSQSKQQFVVKTAVVNAPADDALFAFPAAAPKTTP